MTTAHAQSAAAQPLRRVRWLAALVVVCGGIAPDRLAHTSEPVEQGKVEQDLEEAVASRRSVAKQLRAAQESGAPAKQLEVIRTELETLKYLESVLTQRIEASERLEELDQDLRSADEKLRELRIAGPAERRPYSIFVLDATDDDLAAQRQELRSLRLEGAAQKERLSAAIRSQVEAERGRRRAREALESASDPAERARRGKLLQAARLRSRLASAIVALRREEIAVHEKSLAVVRRRETYLSEKLAAVSSNVEFSRRHLRKVFDELDEHERNLRSEFPERRAWFQQAEEKARRTFDELEQNRAADVRLRQVVAESFRLAKDGLRIESQLFQQHLADIAVARIAWDVRFRLFHGELTDGEIREWKEKAEEYLERARASRQLVADRSRVLLSRLGASEKRRRLLRGADRSEAPWIALQIDIMERLSRGYTRRMTRIQSLQRALDRLIDMMAPPANGATLIDRIQAGWSAIAAAWRFELLSIDDRPITVRKIVFGLALLLLGFFLARLISRLVGRRVIPRLGLNAGVGAAVQSILFYLLITTVTFVSLELVNVPLTVFTFLGGAVAIGIGFGSQNVLNNFISGLILLAEQPIRVGDLVDIDGVCGRVETIGARSTRVKTGGSLEIIVPNSKFLEGNVTNWTLSDARVRTSVTVGVAYGSPTQEVVELLQRAIEITPEALDDPEPIVVFQDFGDNALIFEVHFWIVMRAEIQARQIEGNVRHSIARLLEEAKITIAFPQRDVHLHADRPIEVNVQKTTGWERALLHGRRSA